MSENAVVEPDVVEDFIFEDSAGMVRRRIIAIPREVRIFPVARERRVISVPVERRIFFIGRQPL